MILNEKNDQLKFRILVSTRRPIEAEAEVYNNLTEDVEIFLDNERIFHECHLIYLCVQSHQFDNIHLEIAETFKERVEMIKKRRDKIFPTIVSCMAGVGVWKLKIMLGQEVNIQTTLINCKRINDEIKDIRDDDMYGNF